MVSLRLPEVIQGHISIKVCMDLKLGGYSHHSEENFYIIIPQGHLRSSRGHLGHIYKFVCIYFWYMDVKRNSLCDILKVGEPRQPGGLRGSRTAYFFNIVQNNNILDLCFYI